MNANFHKSQRLTGEAIRTGFLILQTKDHGNLCLNDVWIQLRDPANIRQALLPNSFLKNRNLPL